MSRKLVEESQHRTSPANKISFEEFLAWCDEDTWAEWVNGEVIMVSPASTRHQEVMAFLLHVLDLFVQSRELGVVLSAPFLMQLPELDRAREPDLLFVRRERANLIAKTHLTGPADLVVEIVSPESIGRDRGEKFVEYEKAGIPEYWLIDPDRQQAEFNLLDESGRYGLGSVDEKGIFRSKVVPGFWVRPDWLWKSPLPPALTVLRELKVI